MLKLLLHELFPITKVAPNLYFAGEVIDLVGTTGGFILQLAFSMRWLAAKLG